MLAIPARNWPPTTCFTPANCLVAHVLLGGAFFGGLLLSIAVLAGPGEILHLLAPGTERAFYPEDFIAEADRWHGAVISTQVTLLISGSRLALPATVVQLGWTCKDERNVVAAKAH